MFTQQYSKMPFFNDRLVEILYGSGRDILQKQNYLARNFLVRRTGALLSNVGGDNFNVQASSQRANLIIDYISTIRFLDLKKTASGKKKRNYVQIYNKVLYGFLYGKTFPALRFRMSENIRENFAGTLRAGLNAK